MSTTRASLTAHRPLFMIAAICLTACSYGIASLLSRGGSRSCRGFSSRSSRAASSTSRRVLAPCCAPACPVLLGSAWMFSLISLVMRVPLRYGVRYDYCMVSSLSYLALCGIKYDFARCIYKSPTWCPSPWISTFFRLCP